MNNMEWNKATGMKLRNKRLELGYSQQYIAESGVKPIRLHDLRHSHASWLINNGVNIVAVSKRLGHSDIQTTLSNYTHLLEETDNEMMDKLNVMARRLTYKARNKGKR